MKRLAEATRKLSSGLNMVLLVAGFCVGRAPWPRATVLLYTAAPHNGHRVPAERPVKHSEYKHGRERQTSAVEAGQAALDQRHYDEAIRIYNKLLVLAARDRKTLATVHVKIGSAFVAQRRFDRASAEFQQATTLDPEYAVAHNNLARRGENCANTIWRWRHSTGPCRSIQNCRELAITSASRMAASGISNTRNSCFVYWSVSRPEYDLGYDGLAVTLSRAGRAREALTFHQKAISLNPKEPSTITISR